MIINVYYFLHKCYPLVSILEIEIVVLNLHKITSLVKLIVDFRIFFLSSNLSKNVYLFIMIYQTHGASCEHSILHMPHHANFVKLQDISGVSFQNISILTTHIIFLLQLQCYNVIMETFTLPVTNSKIRGRKI